VTAEIVFDVVVLLRFLAFSGMTKPARARPSFVFLSSSYPFVCLCDISRFSSRFAFSCVRCCLLNLDLRYLPHSSRSASNGNAARRRALITVPAPRPQRKQPTQPLVPTPDETASESGNLPFLVLPLGATRHLSTIRRRKVLILLLRAERRKRRSSTGFRCLLRC
jgi:hypothetical protein